MTGGWIYVDRTTAYRRVRGEWKREFGWHIWIGPLGFHVLGHRPWRWCFDWCKNWRVKV